MDSEDLPVLSTAMIQQPPRKFQYEEDIKLIEEVKKRKVLWDRKYRPVGELCDRVKEWREVAAILHKSTSEVKARFRNLRDTFHREEKKVMPPEKEGKSLISLYTGHWTYFQRLLFLYGNRNAEELIQGGISDDGIAEVATIDDGQTLYKVVMTPQYALNPSLDENDSDGSEPMRKRASEQQNITYKRKLIEPLSRKTDADSDEDTQFVKSLVPYFKKINPLRRLILKNDMQNLLIKEMICDRCRIVGLQPNCRCKLG